MCDEFTNVGCDEDDASDETHKRGPGGHSAVRRVPRRGRGGIIKKDADCDDQISYDPKDRVLTPAVAGSIVCHLKNRVALSPTGTGVG